MDGQVLKVWDWSSTTGSLQSLTMFGTRMDLVNHQPKGKKMLREFIMFLRGVQDDLTMFLMRYKPYMICGECKLWIFEAPFMDHHSLY